MLRHKLMLILALLTTLLMVVAVVALWTLQGIFTDLDRLNHEAGSIINQSSELTRAIGAVQAELHAIPRGQAVQLDSVANVLEDLHRAVDAIGRREMLQEPSIQPAYQQLLRDVEALDQRVTALAGIPHAPLGESSYVALLGDSIKLTDRIPHISRYVQSRIHQQQIDLTRRFRTTAIGIALGFLLVVNGSALLLLRAARMVLRPVDQLVEASRHLAHEDFDYRTTVGQHDEFDELGQAFNNLAEHLQQNEQHKIEVLQQVALTLNHELNNAIATIELQLNLLQRQSGGKPVFEKCLHQIHENLQRMTQAVESLKHVRKIVLTDYVPGTKMLDLQRSIQTDPQIIIQSPDKAKARLP